MNHVNRDGGFEPVTPTDAVVMRWLTDHSLSILRISLGLVFFLFGVLKFFPEVSPAEDLSVRTVDRLTLGLISGDVARIFVATMEVVVGLSLLTARFMKLGLLLLGLTTIGIMAPLFLFTGELFSGKYHAPTLEAQYVVKDIVLAAAGLNVFMQARGVQMTAGVRQEDVEEPIPQVSR